jgi:hypothetical protein
MDFIVPLSIQQSVLFITQHSGIVHTDTGQNDTQQNDTQQNDTQQNDTQQNYTHHADTQCNWSQQMTLSI